MSPAPPQKNFKKWADLNRHFSKEDTHGQKAHEKMLHSQYWPEKYKSELQQGAPLTPVRRAVIKNLQRKSPADSVEERAPS